MLLVGAIAVEAVVAAPGVDTDYPWVAHVGAVSFLLLAVAAYRVALEHYRLVTILNVVVCIGLVSAFVALVDGVQGIEVFYLWPLLGAAYLLRRREVIAAGGMTNVGYGIAFQLSPAYNGFPVGPLLPFPI